MIKGFMTIEGKKILFCEKSTEADPKILGS